MAHLQMTIEEFVKKRDQFQPAPGVDTSKELPLREKQALVDEILRGMPIKQIDIKERVQYGKTVFQVIKGWPQLRAILDFVDGKFPTWTDEQRQEWEAGQQRDK